MYRPPAVSSVANFTELLKRCLLPFRRYRYPRTTSEQSRLEQEVPSKEEMVNLESRERATSSCAANSTPPSLSPPPLDQPHAAAHLPLQKYTPYKFDAPPVKESSNITVEIKPFKASMSDSRVAGPLLLAALESMGEGGDEQSEQGGSSQDGMQRPSLSPNNYSTNSSERTSETSVSGSRDAENGSTANPDSASFVSKVPS